MYFSTATAAVVASPTAVVSCLASWVRDIADGVDPGDLRPHVGIRDEVAILILVQRLSHEAAIGFKTDKDEDPGGLQLARLPRLDILQPKMLRPIVPTDLLHHRVPDELDLGLVTGPLLDDLLRPELIPAVDDIDLLPKLGEVSPLFNGGVPPPTTAIASSLKKGPSQMAQ